jgi:hypothetical protein
MSDFTDILGCPINPLLTSSMLAAVRLDYIPLIFDLNLDRNTNYSNADEEFFCRLLQ